MGSWYKTCGLTKLPIYPGEEVKVVILQKNKRVNHSYATALYSPILGAFEDVYADYGEGENPEKDSIYLLHQENIINSLHELEIGENQHHDIAVKKEGFNGKTFYDAIHEERLKVKCGFGAINDTYDLDFVMFKGTAYMMLVNTYKPELYAHGDFSCIGINDFYKEIDDFCADFKKKYKEGVSEIAQMQDKSKAAILFHYLTTPVGSSFDLVEKLFSCCSFGEVSMISPVLANIRKYITDATQIQTLTPENIQDAVTRFNKILPQINHYLKMCAETKMISWLFEETRQIWTPGFHEGSQANNLSNYSLLLKCTKKEIEALKSQH